MLVVVPCIWEQDLNCHIKSKPLEAELALEEEIIELENSLGRNGP